jgi:hypothetical protein
MVINSPALRSWRLVPLKTPNVSESTTWQCIIKVNIIVATLNYF